MREDWGANSVVPPITIPVGQVSIQAGNAIKALAGPKTATFLSQELMTVPGTLQGDLACFVREGVDYCASVYRSAAPKASPDWVFVYRATVSTIFEDPDSSPQAFQGSYFQTEIVPHTRGDVTSTASPKIANWGSLWTFENTVFAESNAGGGVWKLDLTADAIFAEIGRNSPQGAAATTTYRIPVEYVGPADVDEASPGEPADYWQDGFNCVNASSPWLVCPAGSIARNATACICGPGYSGPDPASCTECPENTYQDTPGSATCTACPEGKATFAITKATSLSRCVNITKPPDFICPCHVPLWHEFHDCNHHPTWVSMTVTMPYTQGDLPEEAFKTAIGSLLFFGGPEENIADRRVEVLLAAAAGSSCGGAPSVDVNFAVRVPDHQAPSLTSPNPTAAQPLQAKLTTANINDKLAEHGLSHTCAVVSAPTPVSRGSNRPCP